MIKKYTAKRDSGIIAATLCCLITLANAGVVYEMITANSTLVSNKTLTQSVSGDTSTGTMTYTVASGAGADKGFVGSASSTDIQGMNGSALTAALKLP